MNELELIFLLGLGIFFVSYWLGYFNKKMEELVKTPKGVLPSQGSEAREELVE